MIPIGLPQFALSYEIAPIILVNGIAQQFSNDGMMTILWLTEGTDSPDFTNLDDYFAHFQPLPGSTLEDWTAAEYPFASFVMAANAMVQNELKISLLMKCPAKPGDNSYTGRQATFSLLKSMLDQHISQGGTFIVNTPAYTYQNCLLLNIIDVTSTENKQPQAAYQWNFVMPLVTQAAAAQSYNGLYNKLAGGLPTTSPLMNSGSANTVGNAASLQPANMAAPQDSAPIQIGTGP